MDVLDLIENKLKSMTPETMTEDDDKFCEAVNKESYDEYIVLLSDTDFCDKNPTLATEMRNLTDAIKKLYNLK